ncbi:hypothetical protein QO006_003010 [Deinococcus enclensis]|uniref:Uncharacterized protein n=1 Tax=Deinococcus enclensis TaxID=1049582 RepID=A0ABT9MG30_9DEIO|nr:hypothetical protein [Deinococcus enclensis]
MRHDTRTQIQTLRSSTLITVGRTFLLGNCPWRVTKVKPLDDGRYRVTFRR